MDFMIYKFIIWCGYTIDTDVSTWNLTPYLSKIVILYLVRLDKQIAVSCKASVWKSHLSKLQFILAH